MKKTIAVIAALIIIGIGIYYFLSNNSSTSTQNTSVPTTQTVVPAVPDTTTAPTSSNATVSIKNFSFSPSALTVKIGTKVTWTNNDSVPHTVTSDTGSLLNSQTLSPGQSFSFTFTDLGTVKYHCNIHPMMKGSVIVEN